MSYKTFVSMDIAIIGVSKIAESYAVAFSDAGHQVYMACKEGEQKKVSAMLHMLDGVHFCSIEDAAGVADLIIIATSPKDVREVSYWLGDVRRKVIIDATSNVFAALNEQVRTVCAIKAITGSQHIVKAFNTKGYEHMLKPLFNGELIDMLLVGSSKKAKEVTKILAAELGIAHCYDFGGDESIALFNAMTTCWRELLQHNPADSKVAETVKHEDNK